MKKTKDKQNNTVITINCDTTDIAEEMRDFLVHFSAQIVQSLTGKITQKYDRGADPSLLVSTAEGGDMTFNLSEVSTNKGTVLISGGNQSLSTADYANLAIGTKYLTYEKDFFFVFVKTADGVLDSNIGHFMSLTGAAAAFDETPDERPRGTGQLDATDATEPTDNGQNTAAPVMEVVK